MPLLGRIAQPFLGVFTPILQEGSWGPPQPTTTSTAKPIDKGVPQPWTWASEDEPPLARKLGGCPCLRLRPRGRQEALTTGLQWPWAHPKVRPGLGRLQLPESRRCPMAQPRLKEHGPAQSRAEGPRAAAGDTKAEPGWGAGPGRGEPAQGLRKQEAAFHCLEVNKSRSE